MDGWLRASVCWAIGAVGLVACYNPIFDHPACPTGECPGDSMCIEGVCYEPGELPGRGMCETFSSQFDTCKLMLAGDLVLSGTNTYNTDTHQFTPGIGAFTNAVLATKAAEVDAIVARSVRIAAGGTLTARGSRPLAIAAIESVVLEEGAIIDVGNGGAGALPICYTEPENGRTGPGGTGGGGGGGAYSAAGGHGSDGAGSGAFGGRGGGSVTLFAGPEGGCAGGGGAPSSGTIVAAGGAGGGALYIAAGDRIQLGAGAILMAGGAGGSGGQLGAEANGGGGGGGGGSGGKILLEAPHVIAPGATIAANGGGGGEGGNEFESGKRGASGLPSNLRARGGITDVGTSYGGDGGSRMNPSGDPAGFADFGGGGGGGGGVGYIHVVSPDVQLSTMVSPAPVTASR